MKQARGVVVGLALLALALFFPTEWLTSQMINAYPDNVRLGPFILRLCIGFGGLLALAWAFLPAGWFTWPGMPTSATGLRLGPEGWIENQKPPSWGALSLIVIAGAALRLIGLQSNLWIDEIATVVNYLRRPPLENFYIYGTANQHQLYSLLGNVSISLFGESEWSARLPAVLFGLGSLVGLYFLTRLIAREREALMVTFLMTFSYHHVWFSQNARGYTALVFCTVWGTYFFARGLAQNRTRDWAAYALTMALGVFALLNTAFVFASHILLYFVILWRWKEGGGGHWPLTRRVLLSAVLVVWLIVMLHSLALPQLINWYRTEDRTGLGWSDPLEFINVVLRGLQSGFGLVGLSLALVLVGSGFLSYLRQSLLVAGLLTLPLILNGLVLVLFKIGAYPRSFLYVLPLAMVLVMRGGLVIGHWISTHVIPAGRPRQLSQQFLGVGLVGLILAASAASVLLNYRAPKQDYSGALDYMMANKAPDDIISAIGLAGAGYREYYGTPEMAYADTVAEMQALQGEGYAVWVVYSFPRDMRLRFPEIFDYVQEYEQVAIFPGTLEDGAMYIHKIVGEAK